MTVAKGKNIYANKSREMSVAQLIDLLEKLPPTLTVKSNFESCDGITQWSNGTVTLHEIEE
jgi:hypothetical protein